MNQIITKRKVASVKGVYLQKQLAKTMFNNLDFVDLAPSIHLC